MASESSGSTQDHVHTGGGDGGELAMSSTQADNNQLRNEVARYAARTMLASVGTNISNNAGGAVGVALAMY